MGASGTFWRIVRSFAESFESRVFAFSHQADEVPFAQNRRDSGIRRSLIVLRHVRFWYSGIATLGGLKI